LLKGGTELVDVHEIEETRQIEPKRLTDLESRSLYMMVGAPVIIRPDLILPAPRFIFIDVDYSAPGMVPSPSDGMPVFEDPFRAVDAKIEVIMYGHGPRPRIDDDQTVELP
jgi:hypothetical protein